MGEKKIANLNKGASLLSVAAVVLYAMTAVARSTSDTCKPSPIIPLATQEYSKALGRTISFQDIPLGPWRDALLARGLPAHLVHHLATMADLHRAGRYDRMSDDVLTLTGQVQ